MKRKLLLLIFLVTTINTYCQSKINIKAVINSYMNISNNKATYELEFIDKEKTFIFKFKLLSNREIYYRVILKDIHPEGIFYVENKTKTFIRILSVDNGHRFIHEKFINGFRIGNTTNIIDIELLKNTDKLKVDRFIFELKNALKKEEVESDEIFITAPLTKKKG